MTELMFAGQVIDGQKNCQFLSRTIPFQLIGATLLR